ncbi:hypothetical protein NQ314_007791 [Rhamnusium bicolor]|uniref:Uncharacterized protein n=1 Tax=Rhamnusium bicolor TaxID=1586634 RepID=A0AAV8YHI1_9CUCU|nr:hypothetical protein NQ314_007791 [Rhamnusium bicolor]
MRLTGAAARLEPVSNPQSKRLQKIERFADIPVEVIITHGTLNVSKGVIFCRDLLNCSLEEIEENLVDQGVISIKRIKTRRDGTLVDTPNLILTFNTRKLPKFINAAMYRLQIFGHIALKCTQEPNCVCGKTPHEGKPCETPYKCVNCEGTHLARDPLCPK